MDIFGEIYEKNFKLDEKGMCITSLQNTMFIDEDEIVAKFLDEAIFKITGDSSWFKKLEIKDKFILGEFVTETRVINNKIMILHY